MEEERPSFLKKEAKNFYYLRRVCDQTPGSRSQSFLVPFFSKKNTLSVH